MLSFLKSNGSVALGCLSIAAFLTVGCNNKTEPTPPRVIAAKPQEQVAPAPLKTPVAPQKNTESPQSQTPAVEPSKPVENPAPENEPKVEPKKEPQAKPATNLGPSKQSLGKPDQILFQDWPKPKAALFITGRQHGYFEPCGCTGLANQKGGLSRRHTFQQQLLEKGWPLVSLDVGNQVRRFGRQPEIKFQITLDALKKLKYDAVGFGPDDLQLTVNELLAAVSEPTPYICANISILLEELPPKFQVIQAGNKKIGVTAVLGATAIKNIRSDEIITTSPTEGLKAIWPKLAAEKCDLYVLLVNDEIEASMQLAQEFPQFKVIVTAGGAGEPTYQPTPIPNTGSIMVQVGVKGMYVGVIGIFDDEKTPLRYQRVPLDGRFKDSPDMLDYLAGYQQQLEAAGLDGLGIKPIPHINGKFVGSEACSDCHSTAYTIWKDGIDGKGGVHAHATDSLIRPKERGDIARHFDPECLSCHVTGWNPQKHYPYTSGYLGLKETPKLLQNGCENCHGPGADHVAAENGDVDLTEIMIDELRKQMRLPMAKAEQKCLVCHDLDNSPDFHEPGAFEKYWKLVEHIGKD